MLNLDVKIIVFSYNYVNVMYVSKIVGVYVVVDYIILNGNYDLVIYYYLKVKLEVLMCFDNICVVC